MDRQFYHWLRRMAANAPFILPQRLQRAGHAVFVCLVTGAFGAQVPSVNDSFRKEIQPILATYCYDCHGDGMKKGGLAFDEFKSERALLDNRDLWWTVLRYVRAGIMPPARKAQPTFEERARLAKWIKYEAFGLDPNDPDPGRITVRRLNRVEYRNTIRDLMGVEFHSEVEFPPDDTGYGFDDIGDVLTLPPMLMEKYITAAKAIVTEAVPLVSKIMPEQKFSGSRFVSANRKDQGHDKFLALSYYEPASVSNRFKVEMPGDYRITLEMAVKGAFDFDPGRCQVVLKVDDRPVWQEELSWHDHKTLRPTLERKWQEGEHQMSIELEPLVSSDKKIHPLELRVLSASIQGPLDQRFWQKPKNYDRFFPGEIPKTDRQRRAYAREVLKNFATKAFRRPVDDKTVARLGILAEHTYNQPDKSFEAGIAQAMVAVLSSPRFLFRVEENLAGTSASNRSLVDEYSLASRLSYFLWSTMPDDRLIGLAREGQLRRNLASEVKRMVKDSRSEAMVDNFVGQWLQTRDVEGTSIDARVVLARDHGEEREMRKEQEEFKVRLVAQASQAATNHAGAGSGSQPKPPFKRRFAQPEIELDMDLRQAMQRETQMYFAGIVRDDRNVLELIDSNYTFLNDKLAHLYGITNVTGSDMRRFTFPPESPRGGILTQGSVLVVTSNPDRTSPVKRGLFILDNLLGTPPPPPPPNIPALEASEKQFKDHQPTLRESLEMHRDKPLCSSCHARMDPLGLAFENFNALGMWRGYERGQKIDIAGQLVTGEKFADVRELKKALAGKHREEFYRCLTEKLLTYALGRGLEYYDVETVDQIVRQLQAEDGKFSALLMGIIECAPFQKQRDQSPTTADAAAKKNSNSTQLAQLPANP